MRAPHLFIPRNKKQNTRNQGFTLVELLVALGVTAVIIAMLVTITATALDGYSASRNQVKASREARSAFNQITRDLESLVVRSGNNFEWLWFSTERTPPGPSGRRGSSDTQDEQRTSTDSSSTNRSPNASRAVFFTSATDRYDGALNSASDNGGNISAVSYRLLYRDPASENQNEDFASYILYRQLINPDETFENLLGQEDLRTAYSNYQNSESDPENFLCENIYEFSIALLIEQIEEEVTTTESLMFVNSQGGSVVNDIRLRGNRIIVDDDPDQYANARIIAVDIALTVVNNSIIETLRYGKLPEERKNKLLERDSYHFSKRILLPQP